jgi:hypothetical protein
MTDLFPSRTTGQGARARVFVITDNPRLARGIDDHPIVIPDNGPLTALIAVLPLQVGYLVLTLLCFVLCNGVRPVCGRCTLAVFAALCTHDTLLYSLITVALPANVRMH